MRCMEGLPRKLSCNHIDGLGRLGAIAGGNCCPDLSREGAEVLMVGL